jgi:hypothetical protein
MPWVNASLVGHRKEGRGKVCSTKGIYLIKPSEALLGWFADGDSDVASIILEPTIWTKSQSDRSSWSREDHVAQIKLLFLCQLKQEFSAQAEYQQLLGDSQLCIDTFDRWWTVESYGLDETAEEVEKNLSRGVIPHIVCTGRPVVDRWISSFRNGGNTGP